MESEKAYLNRRAREEREAADHAPDPKVREVHIELAARYLHAARAGRPVRPNGIEAASLFPPEFRILE